MNKEEKQAIEFMKYIEYKQVNSDEFYDNRDIVLNLIKKQQKRNEEQFEVICHYEDTLEHYEYKVFNGNLINLEKVKELDEIGILGKKYISKDKIRKLIKEKARTNTYNFKTIAVKDLEKLLGETNE